MIKWQMYRKATRVATAAVGYRGLPAPLRRTSHVRSSTRLSARGKVQRPLKVQLATVVGSASLTNDYVPVADFPDGRAAPVGGDEFISCSVMPMACCMLATIGANCCSFG